MKLNRRQLRKLILQEIKKHQLAEAHPAEYAVRKFVNIFNSGGDIMSPETGDIDAGAFSQMMVELEAAYAEFLDEEKMKNPGAPVPFMTITDLRSAYSAGDESAEDIQNRFVDWVFSKQ